MSNSTMQVPENSVRAEAAMEATAPGALAEEAGRASEAACPTGAAPEKPVRGANGRWLDGNPGGSGNPFARQVAAVRQRIYDRITPEMMDQLIDKLYEMACNGSIHAQKLIIQYMAGKTATPPNPDKLDIEEWEHFKRSVPMMAEMAQMFMSLTPAFLMGRLRETRPEVNYALAHQLSDALQHPEEQTVPDSGWDLVMSRGPRQGNGKSTVSNGKNGRAPSANGGNGGQAAVSNGKNGRHGQKGSGKGGQGRAAAPTPDSPFPPGDVSDISVLGNGRLSG